ncbi:hypothetical protein BL253_36615 [Pseudofrankia asymbiotica]|uniref:TIGR04222 domain-containing membrane protein n=1 Tax=Pseudofrankia asymbiotica TaxID=1834516 RepID=A0A1V2HZH1_9ACTN|nr:hypothetical protein BL253_36615 [Pseudofrankia asymbiotica]
MAPAADSPTWGISGPAFAVGYLVALVLVALGVMLVRWRLRAPAVGSPVWPPRRSDAGLAPEELAFLAGGARRAVETTVVALREQGLAASGAGTGRVVTAGAPGPGTLTPFQRAVRDRSGAAAGVRMSTLTSMVVNSPATDDLRRRLVGLGLVVTPARARMHRKFAWWPTAFLVVGFIRLVTGASRHHPVGVLAVELILTVVIAIVAALRTRFEVLTSRGRGLLATARRVSTPLRTGSLPGQRAQAYALFGAAAIWAADSDLARQLGFPQPSASGGGDSAGGCGGGGCGGGGCGGGCGG